MTEMTKFDYTAFTEEDFDRLVKAEEERVRAEMERSLERLEACISNYFYRTLRYKEIDTYVVGVPVGVSRYQFAEKVLPLLTKASDAVKKRVKATLILDLKGLKITFEPI
jgi:hypothetical protein